MMLALREHAPHEAAVPRFRRDPHGRLITAVLGLCGPTARIQESTTRPWASATFVGMQHFFVLVADAPTGAAFAAALPDAEFRVPGHLVADIVVDRHERDGAEHRLHLAALTIEDW